MRSVGKRGQGNFVPSPETAGVSAGIWSVHNTGGLVRPNSQDLLALLLQMLVKVLCSKACSSASSSIINYFIGGCNKIITTTTSV